MKNTIYTLLFLFCCVISTHAQQDAISNHYWITPFVNNPALVGLFNDSTTNISTSILDYWVLMPNAPKSINAIVEIPIPRKRIAVSAFFQQEEYFLFKESRGSIALNYQVPLSNNQEFRVGLGLGFWENRINFSGISIKDKGDDLVINGLQSRTALQFSLSVAYRFGRFCVGTSIPYFILNATNTESIALNSVIYGKHNLDRTSFKKPLWISHYIKMGILKKNINLNNHSLDIVALLNLVEPTNGMIPQDTRLNVLYRFGNFTRKEGKKTAADALKLDALKFGLGYRLAWKSKEPIERIGHGGNAMFGFEIGRFLEVNYIAGMNNSFATVGTTHEVVCKIRINRRKRIARSPIVIDKSGEVDELSLELLSIKAQLDSLTALHDSMKMDVDIIVSETIPKLQQKIELLKFNIGSIEKDGELHKKKLEKELKEINDSLEIWKQILAKRQDIDIEIKTTPNSPTIQKK